MIQNTRSRGCPQSKVEGCGVAKTGPRGWHVLICCDEICIDELFLDLLDFWVCECPNDPLTGSETQPHHLEVSWHLADSLIETCGNKCWTKVTSGLAQFDTSSFLVMSILRCLATTTCEWTNGQSRFWIQD
jgi:hypothetical protein